MKLVFIISLFKFQNGGHKSQIFLIECSFNPIQNPSVFCVLKTNKSNFFIYVNAFRLL